MFISECPIDLALLVDTSGSIAIDPPYGEVENWQKVKTFLEMIVSESYDETSIAMITFDERCVLSTRSTRVPYDQVHVHASFDFLERNSSMTSMI